MTNLTLLAALVALLPPLAGHAQSAAPATTPKVRACDAALSEPVEAAWQGFGGKDGRLGCPLGPEGDTATSVKGTAAREARFEGGVVLRHMSGPLAGKAFAVAACERLYVQYGGPSGWLGLPVAEAVNTPDGQRQRFEGGTLMLYRSLGSCEAERAGS